MPSEVSSVVDQPLYSLVFHVRGRNVPNLEERRASIDFCSHGRLMAFVDENTRLLNEKGAVVLRR